MDRIREARGWDEAELTRRESSQLPLEEKRRRASHTIVNAGTPEQLAADVRRTLEAILALKDRS